ncbi:MAG TPA: cyclopropane-fatty-acyl-phospholipid synthase family protein [Sulfuricella sp.]|nr:cyclopropane-fatty-acyl-phospholipid synthase family protein [Sulfuricella sp.]
MNRQKIEPQGKTAAENSERASSQLESSQPGGDSLMLERWLLTKVLKAMGSPNVRFVLWDGQEVGVSSAPAVARISIRDRVSLLRLVANPCLQFGELYCSGRARVDGGLLKFLETLYRARSQAPTGGLWQAMLDFANRPRSNSPQAARENIHHHYNIGNDFYKLWLDEQLLYTCAYFATRSATLEQAQIAKMDHVCRKLWLKPGEQVVEAGCGWGALALHMAKHYGVRVRAYNIAGEQLAYARERARREGMDDRIEYIEGDYRDIDGECDAFVSVGMLEHVGVEHYHTLGGVIDRCLRQNGRGLIHTIGVNQPSLLNPWIERHIFPGAHPPSLGEMMKIFEPSNFSVLDVENLRQHYAKTLEHWLHRYEAAVPSVNEMFGEDFVRAWRLYLSGSLAAFTSGELQLFQVVFARAADNDIPWTREYLYAQGRGDGKL